MLTLFIFFFISTVSAKIFEEDNKFYVEQDIKERWNLIAGISFSEKLHEKSELSLDSILNSRYYNSKDNKEVRIRPNYEAGNIDPLILYSNAFWIFSVKSGKIIYRVSNSFIDNTNIGGYYQFYKGENLIAINDKMYGKSIEELKGDCKIENFYFYDNNIQGWTKIDKNKKLDFEEKGLLTGKGINVVVKNDCKFMRLLEINTNNINDNDEITSDELITSDEPYSRRSDSFSSGFYIRTIPTYKDLKELKSISQKLAAKERFKLKINDEIHYFGIKEIKTKSAIIEITSNPLIIELEIAKSTKIDLNNNGVYDLQIKLNDIVNRKADLTIEYLSEPIPQDKIEITNSDSDNNDKKNENLIWFIIIMVAVLIILIFVFLILAIKNRKKELKI